MGLVVDSKLAAKNRMVLVVAVMLEAEAKMVAASAAVIALQAVKWEISASSSLNYCKTR
ncbi:hypothetical protein D3C86_2164470 [compost metagenome]